MRENPINDHLSQAALNDLRSSDYKRWRQALIYLREKKHPQLASALISVLREMSANKDWSQRIDAAITLGDIGILDAVPALIEALRGYDEWLATAAAEALGKLKDERAVPSLVDALRSERKLQLLAKAIAEHRERMARKDFPPNAHPAEFCRPDILQFNQDIYDIRAAAATALSVIGSDQALTGLAQGLYFQDSQSSGIRVLTIHLLRKVGTQKVLDILKEGENGQVGGLPQQGYLE